MNFSTRCLRAAGWQPGIALILLVLSGLMTICAQVALAHAVSLGDKEQIEEVTGVPIIPFFILGPSTW